MMYAQRLLILVFVVASLAAGATDLHIDKLIVFHENDVSIVQVEVTWKNAWNNTRNHDAVWLFAKFKRDDGRYRHMALSPSGSNVRAMHDETDMELQVAEDKSGMFIYISEAYRGDVHALATYVQAASQPLGIQRHCDGVHVGSGRHPNSDQIGVDRPG